jgi:hypothetical protein
LPGLLAPRLADGTNFTFFKEVMVGDAGKSVFVWRSSEDAPMLHLPDRSKMSS